MGGGGPRYGTVLFFLSVRSDEMNESLWKL